MAELTPLIAKRGSIKGSITRIEKFIDEIGDNVTVNDLKSRLDHLNELYAKYDDVQLSLEMQDKKDEYSSDRVIIEDKFLNLKSRINYLIENVTKEVPVKENFDRALSEVNSNQLNLPKISLPIFSGDYDKWQNFKDLFCNLVHNCTNISDVQKLYYLKSALRGEASTLIECLHASVENYEVAWDTLTKRYDNKAILLQTHLKGIFDLPHANKNSHTSLRILLSKFGQHFNSLKALGAPVQSWDIILVHIISQKLDNEIIRSYESQRNQLAFPDLGQFLEFLDKRCAMLELTSRESNTVGTVKRTSVNATQVNNNARCSLCKNAHFIAKCKKFIGFSIDQRRNTVRENKLCFKCLKANHFSDKCFSKENCKTCNKPHNSLLHIQKTEVPNPTAAAAVIYQEIEKSHKGSSQTEENSSENMQTDVCTSIVNSRKIDFDENDDKTVVLWPLAIVYIIDDFGEKHKCRALLDSASERNYVTREFINKLNVKSTACSWQVNGVSGVTTSVGSTVRLNVESRVSDYKFIARFGIMNYITGSAPKREFDMKALQWPRHIALADPSFNKVGKIDMLLGTEVFSKAMKDGSIDLGVGRPVFQNTKFGWIVHGATNTKVLSTQISQTLVTSVSNISDAMNKFWQTEEFNAKNLLTQEEKECETKFCESVTRDSTGRYMVDLPVIENKLHTLGNSYDYAYRCLLSLERRFAKNPKLFEDYKAFIEEYLNLGHAKIIDRDHDSDSNKNCTFYMPHHAVIKESSSTTKLRVVFNASASSSTGVSLNDLLLVGPVVQPDLTTTLMRCRRHKYMITADITKMYRQIKVKPKFQSLQRILWREVTDKQVQCIQLTTVTYGTASASFLATRTLVQLVNDEGDKFPLASDAILNNSYVDDIITGANSLEVARKIQQELIELLAKGGFELHKWCSNEPKLLACIPAEKREKYKVTLTNEKISVRTLGIIWKPFNDEFEIEISDDVIKEGKCTKRTVLSCIAKIFDPLGFTGPITSRAKMIMQEIWKENIDWDDQIPSSILKNWLAFKNHLGSLQNVSIPRLMTIDNETLTELHGFCDASMKGYGAVIYLRSQNKEGDILCRIVCSKSRVAPLKVISLPRLELCAALLLARLMSKVQSILNVNTVYLWTDSTIVLSWIASEPSRWNTFVANRVSEIRDLTTTLSWFHVQSADNPADLVSRGLEPHLLKQCSLWWHGPSWLNSNFYNWPDNSWQIVSQLPEERKQIRACVSETAELNYFYKVFDNYSTFVRLQRIIAFVLRFIYNLKAKAENRRIGFLSNSELQDSVIFIIKIVQAENFSKEISLLNNKSDFLKMKTNRLRLLDPFLDKEGLLRVGGRLKYGPIKLSQRHPFILPDKTHVTRLIITYEHEKLLHAGTQLVLANLRLKFWPINARSAIKQVIHRCVKCFKFRASAADQIMADLPPVRITPSRPFLNVGIDYAGPINIRQSRIRKSIITKGYICLFVCMSTKAIHLELVSDMTTKSFLNALNRFISRRGKCAKIYSDNGSNFKGARQELHELYSLFTRKSSTEQIHDHMSKEGIEWNFIPPHSPHWGGIWEAGVKSVKHHLKRMIGYSCLTYEELNTVLIQIEGILNSRPLCPLNNDPGDLEYLSPAHFIIGDVLTACPEKDLTSQPVNRLKIWQQIAQTKQSFWKRWSSEYISELQQRKKWCHHKADIRINDLVIVKEDNVPPLAWCMARIIDVYKGKDDHVRSVLLKTKHGTYVRPIVKICKLPV